MSHDTRISESCQVTSLTWMMKNERGLDSIHSTSYINALRQLSLRITSHHVTSRHVLSRPSHEGVTNQDCHGSTALHLWMHCVSLSLRITSHQYNHFTCAQPYHDIHVRSHITCKRAYILQKRPIILRSLLIVATLHLRIGTLHLRIGWLRLVGSLKL